MDSGGTVGIRGDGRSDGEGCMKLAWRKMVVMESYDVSSSFFLCVCMCGRSDSEWGICGFVALLRLPFLVFLLGGLIIYLTMAGLLTDIDCCLKNCSL